MSILMYDYDYTDKVLKSLRRKIINRFSKFKGLVDFDELNVLNNAKEMFEGLESDAEEAFMRIGKHYAEYYDGERLITKKWLNGYLTSYNPVTTYQYKNEAKRKMYRMYEAFMATLLLAEIDKCMRLWYIQVKQASDDITDKAIIDSARNVGYTHVKWITEHDERVCEECKELDEQIFPIDEVPDKPHYNCRCRLEPVGMTTEKDN